MFDLLSFSFILHLACSHAYTNFVDCVLQVCTWCSKLRAEQFMFCRLILPSSLGGFSEFHLTMTDFGDVQSYNTALQFLLLYHLVGRGGGERKRSEELNRGQFQKLWCLGVVRQNFSE